MNSTPRSHIDLEGFCDDDFSEVTLRRRELSPKWEQKRGVYQEALWAAHQFYLENQCLIQELKSRKQMFHLYQLWSRGEPIPFSDVLYAMAHGLNLFHVHRNGYIAWYNRQLRW